MSVQLKTLSDQAVIAEKCLVAVSFLDRLIGLIGRPGLMPGEGMFFPRCNDIHMWFMRFPIDVVFVQRTEPDSKLTRVRVTSIRERLRPWRLLPVFDQRASEVFELPAGTARTFGVKPGDELEVVWPGEPIA